MSIPSFDKEDIEEALDILSFSIKHFDIDPEMKRITKRILLCVEIHDMNVTLLVTTTIVLAKV